MSETFENYVTLSTKGIEGDIYNDPPLRIYEMYGRPGQQVVLNGPRPGSVEKYGGTLSLTASVRPSFGCGGGCQYRFQKIPGVN